MNMNVPVLCLTNDRLREASRVKHAARLHNHHVIVRLIRPDIWAFPVPPAAPLASGPRLSRPVPEVEILQVPQHHLNFGESGNETAQERLDQNNDQ
jgi:hypothetical protein